MMFHVFHKCIHKMLHLRLTINTEYSDGLQNWEAIPGLTKAGAMSEAGQYSGPAQTVIRRCCPIQGSSTYPLDRLLFITIHYCTPPPHQTNPTQTLHLMRSGPAGVNRRLMGSASGVQSCAA